MIQGIRKKLSRIIIRDFLEWNRLENGYRLMNVTESMKIIMVDEDETIENYIEKRLN